MVFFFYLKYESKRFHVFDNKVERKFTRYYPILIICIFIANTKHICVVKIKLPISRQWDIQFFSFFT